MTPKKVSVKKSKRENLGEQPAQQTTTKHKNCDAVVPNTVDEAKNTETPSEDTKASSALKVMFSEEKNSEIQSQDTKASSALKVMFSEEKNSEIQSQDTKASSRDEEKTISSEGTKKPRKTTTEDKERRMNMLKKVDAFFNKKEFNQEDCKRKRAKEILQSGLFALLRDPKVDDDKHDTHIAEWLYAYKKVSNNMAHNDPLDLSKEWAACRKALTLPIPEQGEKLDKALPQQELGEELSEALPQQELGEELSEALTLAMAEQGEKLDKAEVDFESQPVVRSPRQDDCHNFFQEAYGRCIRCFSSEKKAEVDLESQPVVRSPRQDDCQNFFQEAYGRCIRCFSSEKKAEWLVNDEDPVDERLVNDEDPVDVATKRSSFMHAVVLFEFEDSFTEETYPRFRLLTHFEWDAVAKALCYMFHQSVENTLARIATYLIFLQDEARICIEDDVEHGEWMIRLGGQMQQAAVVMVELLSDGSQEALWCSSKGMATLLYLQLADARLFFARPKLQQIMFDVWRGIRSEVSSRGKLNDLWYWAVLGCGSLVNLLALPVWALLPFTERETSKNQLRKADDARTATIAKIQEAQNKQFEKERKKTGDARCCKDRCSFVKKFNVEEECKKTSDEPFEKDQTICIGKQRYWSKAAYRKAVVEKCRDAVFHVECWVPLLIPRHKRYLAILTNLLFAAYLSWETPAEAQTWLVLFFSSGAWLAEVIQLLGVAYSKSTTTLQQLSPVLCPEFKFWFMDRVNIMELIAFSCVVWSCVLVLYDVEQTEFAQQFRAVGVLFMGISQTMSMLRMSSIFGPLVSMTMNMIVDMIQWVLLLIPIIGCIVASLMTLFKSRPEHAEMLDDDCQSFSGVNGSFADSLLFFMEVQIGREPPLECLHNSRHTFVGPIILNFGLWVVLILMLNMLIAMMAKTFDRIYERSMIDFQYNFIAAVLQTVEEPAVPPVLRMLSVPWRIVELAMSASDANNCIKVHEDICKKVKDDKFTSTQLEHADNIRKSRFKKLHKEQTAEFDDEQKEPNPPAEQKDPEGLQTLDILYKAVQEFVAEHISDAAIQEEIWRKQFAKQLFATDNRVKAVQSALRSEENEELEQLRARCRELEVVNRVQSALSSRDNKELEQLRARCSMEQQELARLRARCQELEDARMGDAKK